ncbi:putative yir3 protein, partial [Plasmodium yoelii yoelii]
NWFPDEFENNGDYQIQDAHFFSEYCDNEKCETDIDKINAGCLRLFDEFFVNYHSFPNNNINIVEYITIWLSYMLTLHPHEEINNLSEFYTKFIENGDDYKKAITGVTDYKSYKDLIDKKNMMNMDIKDISKFYDALILLCKMYTEFDTDSSNCKNCSEKGDKFVKKYNELNENPSNAGSNSYNQLLCTLSTDYDNFKKYYDEKKVEYNDFPSLPAIDKTKIPANCSEQSSKVTSSSSSIANKLIPVLSILVAIAIFLGISYKYSLFDFRKRLQRLNLRIKQIKRKINH